MTPPRKVSGSNKEAAFIADAASAALMDSPSTKDESHEYLPLSKVIPLITGSILNSLCAVLRRSSLMNSYTSLPFKLGSMAVNRRLSGWPGEFFTAQPESWSHSLNTSMTSAYYAAA